MLEIGAFRLVMGCYYDLLYCGSAKRLGFPYSGQVEGEVSFFSEDLVFVCSSPPCRGGGLAAEVTQRVKVCIVTVAKTIWSPHILRLAVT